MDDLFIYTWLRYIILIAEYKLDYSLIIGLK